MKSRRLFIQQSGLALAGASLLPHLAFPMKPKGSYGVQLYTFRKEMAADPRGTLELISRLGIKKIETARSDKGHYYGLTPSEMKEICENQGMELISGHVQLDDNWEKTMDEAVESGQEYLICSSLPTRGQTIDNYRKVAEAFNKAGQACAARDLKFGYHNHEYEFEQDGGKVLYDLLLDETDPTLVHMELDLGWVVAAGKDPMDYFSRYSGRFPLWHLKDMDGKSNHSTEFGKGILDIPAMMQAQEASGVKHIFIEQEEYAKGPLESMKHNMKYLNKL